MELSVPIGNKEVALITGRYEIKYYFLCSVNSITFYYSLQFNNFPR